MTAPLCSQVMTERLKFLVANELWEDLDNYLGRLSNSYRKVAIDRMGETVFAEMDAKDFWRKFAMVVRLNPKAFLVTLLKTAVKRSVRQEIKPDDAVFLVYMRGLVVEESTIEIKKILHHIVPTIREEHQYSTVFTACGLNHPKQRIAHLLMCESTLGYYELFKELRKVDDDAEFLTQCTKALLKKGNSIAFNMVRIIIDYFDLSHNNAVFSLKLSPYQMSCLDKSHQSFSNILRSI